jgi:hypothetical protein
MADDFNAPLPPEILAGFLGEDEPAKQKVKKVSRQKSRK